MTKFFLLLQEHPVIGGSVGLGLTAQSFMETTTPYLQYAGLVLGTSVVAVTFFVKVRDLFRRK